MQQMNKIVVMELIAKPHRFPECFPGVWLKSGKVRWKPEFIRKGFRDVQEFSVDCSCRTEVLEKKIAPIAIDDASRNKGVHSLELTARRLAGNVILHVGLLSAVWETKHETQIAVHVNDTEPHELRVDLGICLQGLDRWRVRMVNLHQLRNHHSLPKSKPCPSEVATVGLKDAFEYDTL